jgi:hypothetical protein
VILYYDGDVVVVGVKCVNQDNQQSGARRDVPIDAKGLATISKHGVDISSLSNSVYPRPEQFDSVQKCDVRNEIRLLLVVMLARQLGSEVIFAHAFTLVLHNNQDINTLLSRLFHERHHSYLDLTVLQAREQIR